MSHRGRGRGVGKRRGNFHDRPRRGRGGPFHRRGRGRGRGRGNFGGNFRPMFNDNGYHAPRQQASSFMTTNTKQSQGGRQKLCSFPISGQVLSFNGQKGFGWIEPTQPVNNLPGAHLNRGRVFIHVRDLVGIDNLEAGQQVRFELYSDDKGLGASNCTINEAPEGSRGFDQPTPHFQNFPPQFDDPQTVISIHVENMFIGGIIGKKGVTIKTLSSESGAKIDITQEEEQQKEGEEKKRRDPNKCRLVNLTGTSEQLKTVVKGIAKILTEISQSLYAKITFLIHQSQAGRLIGKQGVNIKKIKGEKRTVQINISKDPVKINGQPLVTVSLFGPCNDVEEAIDEAINQLSEIYQSMLSNFQDQQPEQFGPHQGGWDQGGYGGWDAGPPPPYHGHGGPRGGPPFHGYY